MMKYRQLGNTGLEVSEIGFGAWGIGGTATGAIAYGPTNDDESKLALRKAFDLGVTFFDTSDLYGYGHSEELIGQTFKEFREKIIISTKIGFLDYAGSQDFSTKHIQTAIEGSLKRLQTDYIDVYQLHSPPVKLLKKQEGILSCLHSLVKEGKIRTSGVSVRSPDDALIAIEIFGFKAVQVNFSLVDQRVLDQGLFEVAERNGAGIICRTPLCFGFLTGKYTAYDRFDSADHRNRWSREQIEAWSKASDLFCSALESKVRQTNAQLALRFCLSYPAVSTVIPGMLKRNQVEENVASSELGPFTKSDLDRLRNTYQENIVFLRD